MRLINAATGANKTCQHIAGGRHCPNCGQQLVVEPLRAATVLDEFTESWMKKGFRRTLIGLFLSPGRHLRAYLRENREELVRPILYLTLTAAFALWALSKSGNLVTCEAEQSVTCHAFISYPVLLQLVQAAVIALALRYVFFRKGQYGFWEYLTVLAYLLAQGFVITGVFSLAQAATDIQILYGAAAGVRNFYLVTALIGFLRARRPADMMRILIAVLVSFALIIAIVIGAEVLWTMMTET